MFVFFVALMAIIVVVMSRGWVGNDVKVWIVEDGTFEGGSILF
jgi:hypothetical protein